MPKAKGAQVSQQAIGELGPDGEECLRMYYFMLLARTISRKAWLLNRQGRVMFSMAGDGQEAADVGSAWALEPGTDLLVPYARDLAKTRSFQVPSASRVLISDFRCLEYSLDC